MSSNLTCRICGTEFMRSGSRGPIPKYCSQKCITKAARTPHRIKYERLYRALERLTGKRKDYEHEYNRRPEVRARHAKRYMDRYNNDPEFRAAEMERMRLDKYPGLVPPAPYTGHRWLDMARKIVTADVDPTSPWADYRYDEMGEAVLALLEGRNMKEAVQEFRRKEFVPRNLTLSLSEFKNDEDDSSWFEKVLPKVESAEETALTQMYIQERFNDVRTKNRNMRHKTQAPSERRKRNK